MEKEKRYIFIKLKKIMSHLQPNRGSFTSSKQVLTNKNSDSLLHGLQIPHNKIPHKPIATKKNESYI